MAFSNLLKCAKSFVTKSGCRFQSSWIPKNLPKAYDWRERGVLSSVRNQGDCGSCWTFGIAGAVEALLRIKRGLCVSISRQELLDCCYNPYGYTSVGYDYIHKKGIALEKHYPYEAKEDLPCRRAKTFGRPGMRVYIDAYTLETLTKPSPIASPQQHVTFVTPVFAPGILHDPILYSIS
ncbi:hypothetical protein OROMI_003113 [Orobanche minor]